MVIILEIDYQNLQGLQDIKIIDIRDNNEYIKKHFNDSLNVPFNLLIIYPERYLDKKKKYLLVCSYGLKSKKTSEILNNNGYNTYSLKGGISNLRKEDSKI